MLCNQHHILILSSRYYWILLTIKMIFIFTFYARKENKQKDAIISHWFLQARFPQVYKQRISILKISKSKLAKITGNHNTNRTFASRCGCYEERWYLVTFCNLMSHRHGYFKVLVITRGILLSLWWYLRRAWWYCDITL